MINDLKQLQVYGKEILLLPNDIPIDVIPY